MADRKTLPAAVVPDSAYNLIAEYAHDNRITVSEALRRLLQSAPDLVRYAKAKGVKVDFGVEAWKGQKSADDD